MLPNPIGFVKYIVASLLLASVAAATLAILGLSPSVEAQIGPGPGSPLPVLVASEGKMTLVGGTVVSGDVHTNASLVVRSGALVEGDASAVGSTQIQGTVTGAVTSSAPYREFPAQLTPLVARDIADQIYESDHDFVDATITGTIYVEGDVRFLGTLNGSGMVIASGDIEVGLAPSATPGQPVPDMNVSLSAHQSITLLDGRSFRGSLDAGGQIVLKADSWMMGPVLARGLLNTGSGARVVPVAAEEDETPPEISALEPSPDALLVDSRPLIGSDFTDRGDGVDAATFALLVDGFDSSAEATHDASGFLYQPALPLTDGPHQIAVSVADLAGNQADVAWSFAVDTTPPDLAFTAPGTLVEGDATPEVGITFADAGSGVDSSSLEVLVDGLPVACLVTAGGATCEPAVLTAGSHSATATIRDQVGFLASASLGFEVVLDLAAPTVTIETPVAEAMVNTPAVQVAGTVADDGEVVEVRVNGSAVEFAEGGFSEAVLLDPGFNAILVVATDATGKQGYDSTTVTLDTTPPVVAISLPAEGAPINQPSVRLAGLASDDRELASVVVNGTSVTPDRGRFEVVVALSPGVNLLTATAADRAGNTTVAMRTVTFWNLPTVEISSPADLAELTGTSIDVTGTVSAGTVSVSVNLVDAEVSGSNFTAIAVPLVEGGNSLTATATDAAGLQSTDTIHVVRDLTPPRVVVDHPLSGAVVDEATVAVWGLVNDIVPGTVNGTEATVTVNGLPAAVANRSFRVADVPLFPGDNTLSVVATDAAGNSTQATVQVRRATEPVARIRVVSGDGQSATVGVPLTAPLVVEVLDVSGNPVAGETVIFKVKGSDGSLDGGARRLAVSTDSNGRAQTGFTLGHRSGLGNQRVEALAVGYAGPAMFSAIALPGPPSEIVVDAGGLQVGITGQALPRPLIAAVTDGGRNRLAGVPVTFSVVKGQGHLPGGTTSSTVATDSDGRAITTFVLGPDEGSGSDVVEARIDGVPASSTVGFVASARAAAAPLETAVSGVVLDNTGLPVEGVTVRVRDTLLTALSDAQGQFRIAGVPVGSVQMLVEGATANRPGSWPDLEFDLVTVPGRENPLTMPIFLLPIDLDNGLWVDETTGGTLTLPDLPGFSLDVAAGSVSFPGGGHSGLVSVTAVHYDKVPMTPNFGQQPRLIVTIQPAGARFEPPARLTLPNVEGLAPGAVTEMYSFDHDLGHFVSVGPATVSDDGSTMTSNPGVGIVKAGWHCGGDPAASGAPHACPPCTVCTGATCVPGCALPASAGGTFTSSVDDLSAFMAPACTCSDGNSCTVNDVCGDDGCLPGDPKQIVSVSAQAAPTRAAVGEPIQLQAIVEQQNCSDLEYVWTFDDGTTSMSASTTHVFQEPGIHEVNLKVTCEECGSDSDTVVVTVDCAEIEITGEEPDITYICPGCDVQYTATTHPVGQPVFWRVAAGGLFGKATISQSGLLTVAPDAPNGIIVVQASTLSNGSDCSDTVREMVFKPPPVDRDGDRTPAESDWIRQHPYCAWKSSTVKRECRSATVANVGDPDDGTYKNAWEHAYCNCIVASRCDVETAKQLWDAHEDYMNNVCNHAVMDLHNNEIGRQVSTGDEGMCPQLITDALNDERLRWMDPVTETGCPAYKKTP